MSEEKIVSETKFPNTISSLIKDFKSLGIKSGMNLIVHSSLSSLGWTCGGAQSVIMSLEEILTENGTLIMPSHSCNLSDPSHWGNPSVPENWWQTIKDEMPAFDKDLTPTCGMGIIAETFRKQNGVVRSSHPSCSFAAWGKNKDYIVQDNHYDFAQNDLSPIGRLNELDGFVLLLGIDYDKNTSLHLAEYRADYKDKIIVPDGFSVIENGKKIWIEVKDILYNDEDFCEIGNAFEKTGKVIIGKVGNAVCKLMKQRELVDFAKDWMEKNR